MPIKSCHQTLKNINLMRNSKFNIYILAITLVSTASFAGEMIYTDRYTLSKIEATEDQKAPLTTIVTLTFSKDVGTIGDAITELLNGSGYKWAPKADDDSLNALPLPSVVRTFGPIRLNDALATIAGEAWQLRVDELHRVIWFDINSAKIAHKN